MNDLYLKGFLPDFRLFYINLDKRKSSPYIMLHGEDCMNMREILYYAGSLIAGHVFFT